MNKSPSGQNIERFSISRLYDRYALDIYRYSFSLLKDQDEAKDSVQETFMRYAEKENTFKGNCSQKTWLLIIARNYCYNRLKSNDFKNKRINDEFELFADEPGIDLKLTLREAMVRLSDEQRELIFLVDYAGYKYAEISEMIGQTLDNIKIKVFRARQRLKQLCNER